MREMKRVETMEAHIITPGDSGHSSNTTLVIFSSPQKCNPVLIQSYFSCGLGCFTEANNHNLPGAWKRADGFMPFPKVINATLYSWYKP